MKNEPAFPQKEPLNTDYHGMTLRDYFAAKALQGYCSDQDFDQTPSVAAKWAYQVADAMLKAREQEPAP